ncbi:MAG: glycoside hydrolase family 3 C-terminal domain-containing protein [Promicromonosporaceae bacterium]|nr:glycoside hydrolase family 3 C-terminal domain-containing protein [Promicromonosporaceae bacterium]
MSTHLTPTQRAEELLTRMTLEEKAQQVSAVMPNVLMGSAGYDETLLAEHLGHGIGHISNVAMVGSSPEGIAQTCNAIQDFLVRRTRLGIPAVFHAEALNGVVAPGFTSFPTAIGLAATWNPAAVGEMAAVIREQMKTVGLRHALSPVLDLARDARWGRIHETYGEDAYLASAFGVAFVQGLHGPDLREGVLATAKHFLGYSATEAGQNMAVTQLGKRELYDAHATPFEAAIKLAGLRSVMNSYSEIDGVPVGASREILTDLLRGRMGFTGAVVSDYSTVEWLHTRQQVAASNAEAGLLALNAGLDLELPIPSGYGQNLVAAVREGRLDEAVLNEAVLRLLVDKYSLGLFENPYASRDSVAIAAVAAQGDDLSRRLADQAMTLVANDGVLPLRRGTRVAVVGPNADAAMVNFAAYTYPASLDMLKGRATGESRMAGIESMSQMSDEARAAMAQRAAALMAIDTEQVARGAYGALPLGEAIAQVGTAEVSVVSGVGIHPDDPQDIAAAVAAAKKADVVVLAVGGRCGWFGTRITEGEGTDMATIELPEHQVALARAVAATGKPLVAVVHQGRPYALTPIADLCAAILVAYYPGPRGSQAVAGALFGDVNPSGRLPYSLPRATGQVPLHYGQKRGSGYRRGPDDMFRGYIDLEPTPLFGFGHGLSYTTFEYGPLTASATEIPAAGGTVELSVEVANTGERSGTEVVQFYAADTVTGVTRPAQQLVGFARVDLAAGERRRVTVTVASSQLGYSGLSGRFERAAATVEFAVGASSDDLRGRADVVLVGPTADLEGRRTYLSETRIETA